METGVANCLRGYKIVNRANGVGFTTRDINTNITLKWAYEQFTTTVNTSFYSWTHLYLMIWRWFSHINSVTQSHHSVYVLLMMSQSIADHITNASQNMTIGTRACENCYLIRYISISFTAIFTTARVWNSRYSCTGSLRLIMSQFKDIITHMQKYSDSDSDSDRGLFNIKLHTKVLHQVYIAKQYKHIEQIWTWHNQKYLLGDLY